MLQIFPKIKTEYFLFFLAVAIRVAYLYWGTVFYFDKAGIQVLSDTYWWSAAAQNLIETGVYTVDPLTANGYFYRPPGYSFFLMPFYLIFENWQIAFKYVVFAQIIIDGFATILVYRITREISGSKLSGIFSAILYAFYFFALGWTVVTYPESLSLFFLIAAIYFFMKALIPEQIKLRFWLLTGVCLGITALMRIQLILLIPIPFVIYIFSERKNINRVFKPLLLLTLGFVMTYGLWPIRNILIHQEFVFTQRLEDAKHWSSDYMTFRDFVWSVKTDIEPEYTQLMAGEKIEWPKEAHLTDQEMVMANHAITLMDSCGTGLRTWRISNGYSAFVKDNSVNCNNEIATIWNELINNQKSNNSFHYYVTVPIGNLKKAFFKTSLVNSDTHPIVNLAFIARTAFLILGIFSAIYLISRERQMLGLIMLLILCSFVIEYIFFSFFLRSIEMRYFMQVDTLLLIPSGIVLSIFTRQKLLKDG